MGNWNINIQGTGCHHNSGDNPTDAEKMTKEFVEKLAKVHSIEHATFTYGGKENVLPVKKETNEKA